MRGMAFAHLVAGQYAEALSCDAAAQHVRITARLARCGAMHSLGQLDEAQRLWRAHPRLDPAVPSPGSSDYADYDAARISRP